MNALANPKLIALIAVPLILVLFSLSFVIAAIDRDTLGETAQATTAETSIQNASVESDTLQIAEKPITDEVLWLARVIYSETKRPYEQELVAWVVRNRMETRYRGQGTYRGVVLDPWQFSAFNRNSPKRRHYTNLHEGSQVAGWQTAVEIARDVYHAPADERPFVNTTRHFYSERSMVGRRAPAWAAGQRPVALDRQVDPRRFRFFANIL